MLSSKQALEKLKDIAIYEENNNVCSDLGDCCDFKGELVEVYEKEVNAIEKDLEILEQYRGIECELGIDLITLFKALKNGVWTNQEDYYGDEKQGKIRYFKAMLLLDEKAIGCVHNSMFKGKENIRTLYFKDYGKTWALDKKELTKEEL